ncbi:MAG: hypothetical protein H6834_06305 [Planctomycetes bacterium]|nr:hypothetical protein [Planctomycetota bacterium]
MNRLLVLALAVMLFGLGFLLGDSFAPRVSETTEVPPLGMQRGPRRTASSAGPAFEATNSTWAPEGGSGELEDDQAQVERVQIQDAGLLAQARARMEPAQYARGDGAITGACRTINGRPLEGVLVRAFQEERQRSSYRYQPQRDPSLAVDVEDEYERNLAEMLEQVRRRRSTLVETRTDAEGRFVLRGLGDATHTVEAFLPGHEAKSAQGSRSSGVRPGGEVAFVLEPLYEVTIRVLMPNGELADRANVSIHQTNWGWGGQTYAWTPEQTRVWLGPGKVSIAARRDEEGEPVHHAPGQDVILGPGMETAELTFRLESKIRLAGKILPGKPEDLHERTLTVRALRYKTEQPPDLMAGNTDGSTARIEVEGDHWTFVYPELESGNYAFGLYEGSDKATSQVNLSVTESGEGPTFRLGDLDLSGWIRVRVLDPDGMPLDRANFRWTYEREGRTRNDGTYAKLGEDSVYLVRRPGAEDPEMQGALFVSHGLYGEIRKEVRPWADQEVSVRYRGAATLRVNASSCMGTELAERVRFELKGLGDEDGRRFAQTGRGLDANGGRTLGPLQPGEYLLELQVDVGSWSFRPVQELPVTLTHGERVLDVVFPALHDLIVQIPSAVRGDERRVWLSLHEFDTGKRGKRITRMNVGTDGKTTFQALLPGTYELELGNSATEGSMVVNVPGSNPVVFAAVPQAVPKALEVEIETLEGALARAGLRTGDLIVGIGSHAFEEPAQMTALFQGLPWASDDAMTLHVMRGGARQTLQVDPQLLRDRKAWGGVVRPERR